MGLLTTVWENRWLFFFFFAATKKTKKQKKKKRPKAVGVFRYFVGSPIISVLKQAKAKPTFGGFFFLVLPRGGARQGAFPFPGGRAFNKFRESVTPNFPW